MIFFLQSGQFGVADLDAEITARDHDHVGSFDDLAEQVESMASARSILATRAGVPACCIQPGERASCMSSAALRQNETATKSTFSFGCE